MSGQDQKLQPVLVTGANRGIGAAIATGLARLGHPVAVGARRLSDADDLIRSMPAQSMSVALDITDASSVRAAVDDVVEHFGRIGILVNNAGGHYDLNARASEVDDAEALDALEINLLGAWRMMREAIPHMRAQQWGRIVNVSSRAGSFAESEGNAPAYSVSKAALNMLTVQIAAELRDSGILVNACCPGWVRTNMGGPEADLSPADGADTPIWLATLQDDGPSGGFFAERTESPW